MSYSKGKYELSVSRNCVTLHFLETSRFDGATYNYAASDAVEELTCVRCRNASRKMLHWIMQCRDDVELAEWCSLQYSGRCMKMVCHSPRSLAIDVLLDEYKCTRCRK